MELTFGAWQPDTGKAAFLAGNATLVGRVSLGAGASVWYGAVLRGDLEPIDIGAGTNVQDGCVLHVSSGFPLSIGTGCSLGHGAIVHGCTVGDNVLVGMGAVLLNGCQIGEGSVIAAGAVVAEGAVIPPGSLVMGVPARVRGPLREEQKAMIAENAAEYHELAQLHAGLKEKEQGHA